MMFKYPVPTGNEDVWSIVDGFDEINWQDAWLVVHKSGDVQEEGPSVPGLSILLKDPESFKPDEPHGPFVVPEEMYIATECSRNLFRGTIKTVPVLYVTLRKDKDALRLMVVHQGYILNDAGKTVERLYSKVR
jgi:hypothetical protein